MPARNSSRLLHPLLALSATSVNLLLTTVSWGQDFAKQPSQIEAFSTRAADLLPQSWEYAILEVAADPDRDRATPETRGGQFQATLFDEKRAFAVGFGSIIGEPTVLKGPTRDPVVSALSDRLSVISLVGHLRQRIARNQALLLEAIADPQLLGFDFSYTIAPRTFPGTFSLNFANQRSEVATFEEGERDVDLPNGDTPWVHRLGGGIEYFRPIAPKLDVAVGVNYQRVSVRDRAFTSDIEPVDELGNKLTFSDRGQDDLLTLNLAGLYDTTDDRDYPNLGTRVRFGVDQSIPVGNASITYTRLAANISQFIPVRLFGSNPHTLVLNFQTGTMLGDVPPYDAFNLGGAYSVRGFRKGELATGSSFVQTTAEYRFPLFSFSALQQEFNVRGVLFVDYGSDLGTADEVTGRPGEVRDKWGDGLGYGGGLQIRSPLGLVRLEYGRNDRGGDEFHFVIGDRF